MIDDVVKSPVPMSSSSHCSIFVWIDESIRSKRRSNTSISSYPSYVWAEQAIVFHSYHTTWSLDDQSMKRKSDTQRWISDFELSQFHKSIRRPLTSVPMILLLDQQFVKEHKFQVPYFLNNGRVFSNCSLSYSDILNIS